MNILAIETCTEGASVTLYLSGVKSCYCKFYRSKTKQTGCDNKCFILLLTGIYSRVKQSGSSFGLFRRESVGFSLDTVVFLASKDLFFSLSLFWEN